MPDRPSHPASADIIEFLVDYVAAYGSGSLDTLRRFYTDESLVLPNQRSAARGWANVCAMFSPSVERFDIVARVHLQEIRGLGEERFVRFLTELRLAPRDGSTPTNLAFRDFALLRYVGTRWTILRNIDQPITLEQLQEDLARDPPLTVIGTYAEEGGY